MRWTRDSQSPSIADIFVHCGEVSINLHGQSSLSFSLNTSTQTRRNRPSLPLFACISGGKLGTGGRVHRFLSASSLTAEVGVAGSSRTLTVTLFMGEMGGNFSKDSCVRRLTGLTGRVANAASNIEYRSIWPIGAAVAVIGTFSEVSASSAAFGFSTPQFTGFRLISFPSPSFAVAGTKKLFIVCLLEMLALLPNACWRKLGDPAPGPPDASRKLR